MGGAESEARFERSGIGSDLPPTRIVIPVETFSLIARLLDVGKYHEVMRIARWLVRVPNPSEK